MVGGPIAETLIPAHWILNKTLDTMLTQPYKTACRVRKDCPTYKHKFMLYIVRSRTLNTVKPLNATTSKIKLKSILKNLHNACHNTILHFLSS